MPALFKPVGCKRKHRAVPLMPRSRLSGSERFQKYRAIHAILGACLIDGMEARDWAANASHLEVKKDADRRGEGVHHVIDQSVKINGHERLR
jgi:hypothetical protein